MGIAEALPDAASRSPSPDFSPLAIGTDLSPLPTYKAAGTTSVDFGGLLASSPLLLREDLSSGCGGQTWPAGMVLAKHMLRYHASDLGRTRILELGAGGGLVGLAVAKGCNFESPMMITDQLEMFDLMGYNIALNQLQERVQPLILNWGEDLPSAVRDLRPNVILAADCVYFEPAFPLLLETLQQLLTLTPEAKIYFCFKKRRRADLQFLKSAKKAFHVTEVADDDRPVFGREGLFLFTFEAKTANARREGAIEES